MFFYLFYFASGASVSPLDHDKVTDLDLVKNANRIFPYLLLRNFLFLLLRKSFYFASDAQRFAAEPRQGHGP